MKDKGARAQDSGVLYLGWFDADPRKPVEAKIEEAVKRYIRRFGRKPNLCLVHREVQATHQVVEVRPVDHVHRHHFLVGYAPRERHTP